MTLSRLLLPLSLSLLAACAQQPRQTVELDADSECPKRLQVGQTLSLSLASNPSTGYRWTLKDPASSVLRSLGPEVYSTPEEAGIVGSAGLSNWRFQAKAEGTATLALIYQQPWAPEVAPVQTFECQITVR
ncbi:protease inhibitor I42 family protein [Pseudomonas sp. MH2]|uniref:Protease inhibitor I42 family protein n=1 Tax=Pseudomonas machongensis TaxID=3110229 RepID=A0ABU5V9Q5_9PSED|nr:MULTISPECIES: protease inhibitor I42 family protein [Pseudomonas]ANC02156.1 peptidase inhibitor I42 [Pseudomonas putida]MBH3462571.1 protease inhibitor I42 family protein [Pseudomonas putida]MEA5670081.1 protease inhibitor I42 family protein [Pseudomonas sp. MH2]RSC27130.1 peptidase inhibitor I42 [Pseudomonas putida]